LKHQIDSLTEKILVLDEQAGRAEEVRKLVNRLEEELNLRKNEIQLELRKNQDLITKQEMRLQDVPANQFLATIPEWRRRFISWITRRADEIKIQSIISSCEAKISQLQTLSVNLTRGISQTDIIQKAFQDASRSITAVSDSLRAVRIDLGKTLREFQLNLRNQTNEAAKQATIDEYVKNIERLDEISLQYTYAISENRRMVNKLTEQLGELKKVDLEKFESKSASLPSSVLEGNSEIPENLKIDEDEEV